jgi:hypothetical protein
MGMESFGAGHNRNKRREQANREKPPGSYTLQEFADAHKRFAPIEAKFAALPETGNEPRYVLGQQVKFPISEGSNELAEWKVVRSEKGHCFLERPLSNGEFMNVFCSEEELDAFNKTIN